MADESPKNGVLRLAVAMRGGVSLAVWIGGALAEIDGVCRGGDDPFTERLKELTRFERVEVDILTGASAGGLNAALAGMALARQKQMNLRETWIDTADIDKLLESAGPRRSLLNGDYFRSQVIMQLENLATIAPCVPNSVPQPVETFLAATVFGGVAVTDSADPKFSDRRREAFFHFRHLAADPAFSDLILADAPDRLGNAARASASFPAAFEPISVHTASFEGELTLPPVRTTPPSVPLLDGGLVDNIPVARAIQAAARAPASETVRRWVVFLHPSPTVFVTEPEHALGPKSPSPIDVVRDLMKGRGAETLLDDLEVLHEHNREAESQQLQRVSLCKGALAALDPSLEEMIGEAVERAALGFSNGWVEREPSLGSVDADCLYALLDNPAASLAWLPIGSSAPVSPIRDLQDHDRYELRRHFVETLVGVPGTVRPYAQLVRLAYLTIEWIRWVEGRTRLPLSSQRVRAYDVLLVSELLDATIAQDVLAAPGTYLVALDESLHRAEKSSAIHQLAHQLVSDAAEARHGALVDRLTGDAKATLKVLASGLLPESAEDTAESTRALLLETLANVCFELYQQPVDISGAPPSVFTALIGAIKRAPEQRHTRVAQCLLAVDGACAGLHRGQPVGTPHNLDYIRISGALTSPFADTDFAPGLLPKFAEIQVHDNGEIDPGEKLSGNNLANFSAFVSPRFRANDWMWGKMDAASGLIDLLVRPDHLQHALDSECVRRAVTAEFPCATESAPAYARAYAAAAATLSNKLWELYGTEVKQELVEAQAAVAAGALLDDRYLCRTRQLLLTRWQLGLLISEAPQVLVQPLEPGDRVVEPELAPGDPSADPVVAARACIQGLITQYEASPRRVRQLWGTPKTTALGVRVADRAARAVVPGGGAASLFLRPLVVAPLFLIAAALSRGAFLIGSSLLVNIVLAPRLKAVTHLAVVFTAAIAGALFWRACVKRHGVGAWRGYASGFIALSLTGIGVATTWWHPTVLYAPTRVAARSPWVALSSSNARAAWSAGTVGIATFIAALCFWVWARPVLRFVVALLTGVAFAWWEIVGAWTPEKNGPFGWKVQAAFGSMWFPAVALALLSTILVLRFNPENRPRPAHRALPNKPESSSADTGTIA